MLNVWNNFFEYPAFRFADIDIRICVKGGGHKPGFMKLSIGKFKGGRQWHCLLDNIYLDG